MVRRRPTAGDTVQVRAVTGKWYPGVIDGVWGPGDGTCPEPEAVNLSIEAEGQTHRVNIIAHRDFAPAFAQSYWIWPEEAP